MEPTVTAVLAVVGGLALLAFASEHFVVGASRLALVMRVSPVVVGAVVIGFGTSTPELLASGLAAAEGSRDLALGNVVGSNAANSLLVLGVASLVHPVRLSTRTLRREAPLSTVAVLALAAVLFTRLGRVEAVVLLAALAVVIAVVLVPSGAREEPLTDEVEELLEPSRPGRAAEVVRTIAGLAGTIVGAQLLVWGATSIAHRAGIGEGLVGFSLVAVGTSLPELVTGIQSARKKETDLVIGNVLGSNIFNSLFVAAVVGLVAPGGVGATSLRVGTAAMSVAALVSLAFMVRKRAVVRWEAGLLILVWAASLVVIAR